MVDLDVELEIRLGQVDREAEPHPHGFADHPRELHRAQRIALVAPPRPDGERAARAPAQQRYGGIRRGGGIALAAQPGLHHAHARQREAALDERRLWLTAREDEDPAAAADLERAEVAGQPAQVALEDGDERGPVAPLQRQLAELEQYTAFRARVLHEQEESSAWLPVVVSYSSSSS